MFIHVLHLQMITLKDPSLPQATTCGSTIYKPQPVETRARISCYGLHSITSSEVPSTNYNLYSRQKISTSLVTTCDCLIKWKPSVRAITRTLTLVPPTILNHNSRNVTCLPSILSRNSRNVILSHNSRNTLENSIIKVSPKALQTTHHPKNKPLPLHHRLVLLERREAKTNCRLPGETHLLLSTKCPKSFYLCRYRLVE